MIVQRSTAYSPTPTSALSAAAQQKRQETSAGPAMVAETVTISQTARDALAAASATPPAEKDRLESYAMPSWEAALFPVELSGTLGAKASDVYLKGGNLVGRYDNELAEYGQRLDGHLRSLMEKEGIHSTAEYHQAMVVDTSNSERLRLLLKDSIEGDQRMVDLMSKLGIAFS